MNSAMILKQEFRAILAAAVITGILAAGSPLLVAENVSSPARVAFARITALSGRLLDRDGHLLKLGSELKPGDVVKTLPGESARLVLGSSGTTSSIICIEPDSEVAFLKISPSSDSDYPLLDTVISLRNDGVRDGTKRIF